MDKLINFKDIVDKSIKKYREYKNVAKFSHQTTKFSLHNFEREESKTKKITDTRLSNALCSRVMGEVAPKSLHQRGAELLGSTSNLHSKCRLYKQHSFFIFHFSLLSLGFVHILVAHSSILTNQYQKL